MDFFKNVRTFSFFLAPSRSGHSVVAHLLSAHPDVMFSDELDALMWFDEGFRADQVYTLIKFQNYRYGKRGRRKSGYSYQVESSWQYQWGKQPQVIGDSKGRQSNRRVAQSDDFAERLRATTGVPLRVFVQARHPYLIVASEIRNRGWSVAEAVERVVTDIETIDLAKRRFEEREMMTVYHEDVLNNPRSLFREMFDFLEVNDRSDVLDQCEQKVLSRRTLSLSTFNHRSHELDRLDEVARRSEVFCRYFEDKKLHVAGLPDNRLIAKIRRRLLGRI